jgi:hypothetical protein
MIIIFYCIFGATCKRLTSVPQEVSQKMTEGTERLKPSSIVQPHPPPYSTTLFGKKVPLAVSTMS